MQPTHLIQNSRQSPNKINIRPDVRVFSLLKSLNYTPYSALAEFVDNAIDSFQKHKDLLEQHYGPSYKLQVAIELQKEEQTIVIRDNAGGIYAKDYARAFTVAVPPPDNSGLSEFGMGMKAAACWFTNHWEVRTTNLGEEVARIIHFDIPQITKEGINELPFATHPTSKEDHYTVITLRQVSKMPQRRTKCAIKDHLTSIYRTFLREGTLELRFDGELLAYTAPKVLEVPFYKEAPDQVAQTWKRELDIDFGSHRVQGFVALLAKMSGTQNSLALFRRGRVIQGSPDKEKGFRPTMLFGEQGSHAYKRLFGELHLEGFKVSSQKDAFQEDENFNAFLDALKEDLEKDPALPLLKQARHYRQTLSIEEQQRNGDAALRSVGKLARAHAPDLALEIEERNAVHPSSPAPPLQPTHEQQESHREEIEVECPSGRGWKIYIEHAYDPSIEAFIDVGDHLIPKNDKGIHEIGIRLSLVHPFAKNLDMADKKILKPILRMAIALGISEEIAKMNSLTELKEVRRGMNDLLKGTLSKKD